jgi:hypothetical protein
MQEPQPPPEEQAPEPDEEQSQAQGPEQFSDDEMAGIHQYGQALGGKPTDFEEEVEKHLQNMEKANKRFGRASEQEAQKMRAAETGGAGPGLGPTEAEEALAKQQATLQQQAAAQGQQQAAAAQQQQTSPTPPPAPTGSQGVTQPYPAQRQQQPPPAPEGEGQ